MAPIKLPKALVIEKATEAYQAGRLSAQGPHPACVYRDADGRPCVVGAALSDPDARRLIDDGGLAIESLIYDGVVRTNAPRWLQRLQEAHDQWCSTDGKTRVIGHRELCKLLGLEFPTGAE